MFNIRNTVLFVHRYFPATESCTGVLAIPPAYDYNVCAMNITNTNIPNPKEIEKEVSDFLTRKYGNQVKVISPIVLPQEDPSEETVTVAPKPGKINFDIKPEELIAYLDQYIIKQDDAKQILATKICTHFNRIRHQQATGEENGEFEGRIKNNIIMIGPTGVGKTYMIRLIAKKIGVPFVKGDATKFSETGYVGGDVEDLVRDLARESDNDLELAQYGIIYIDEIDKIASSHNLVGADVSRTGVQRALLKPMEETEVDLKVPHDPISMIQEVEHFRKTGKREKRSINTRNILFIVSGAFNGLAEIIKKRTSKQNIGFGATIKTTTDESVVLQQTRAEDLVEYGFESEFIGRLPVRTVFDRLTAEDLLHILQNPNNPIILSKRLDFATYGIDAQFSTEALDLLSLNAYAENTGARGLVSVIEQALIPFETRLPSSDIHHFPITPEVIESARQTLRRWIAGDDKEARKELYDHIAAENRETVVRYINENRQKISEQYELPLSAQRVERIADYYCTHAVEIGMAVRKVKADYLRIRNIEQNFYNTHDINIVFEDDAIEYLVKKISDHSLNNDMIYHKLTDDFEYGLKLLREKTGKNRFFISEYALKHPAAYLDRLIRKELNQNEVDAAVTGSRPDTTGFVPDGSPQPES